VLYDFLAGNFPISLIILAAVGGWAYRNRSSISLAMNDPERHWAIIGKVAVYSTVLFIAWVTLLDNWRQLLGYMVITGRRFATDPFELAATPDLLRYVSLALLAVSIVSLALLYARHLGSYAFLIVCLTFAPLFAFTFNEIRISADAFLRLSEFALENPSLLDAGSILFWAMGMFVITAAVVMTAYLTVLALVALPLRIFYGATQAPKHEELAQIFESYERRARHSREQQAGDQNNTGAGINGDAPARS
jgi:hypothetical protein